MIEKWEIQPSPTDKNKARHKLLLKCDMKDIFFIVKKLGSICSRPEKLSGEYNFLMYISKLEMDTMSKLKSVIQSLSDFEKEDEKESLSSQVNVSNEPVFDLNQIKEKESSTIATVSPSVNLDPKPSAEKIVPPPIMNLSPENNLAKVEPPKMEIPGFDLDSSKIKESSKIQVEEKKSEPLTDNAKIVSSITPPRPPSLSSKPQGAPPPSITGRIKKTELEKSEVTKKEATIENEQKFKSISKQTVKANIKWSVELPLNPTLNFQTLISGPHNRFAHAAAMAVVENPGVMYNPLLIFGPQGVGKTHFLHSIAYGLASNMGQKSIFFTDAVRLSVGVDMALKHGWIENIENVIKEAKVIVIDDIDLFMLNETNKNYISKILSGFLSANKQIVVSSLFPPKTLAPLEQSLGFQFTQGWMVDIKIPNIQTYKLILNQMFENMGLMDVKLSEENMKNIFLAKMLDFRNVYKILNDVRKIEKYLLSIDNSLTHTDLLELIVGLKGDDESYPTEDEILNAQNISFPQEKQWFRWGMFYPKGMEKETKYVLTKFKEFAKELNINLLWNQVFIEEYNPDEILGIPFKIGSFSIQKDINGLILIGPQPTSALGTKENEFRHLTEKILESFNIKTAWIPSTKLKAKSVYLSGIMELI